jgi:hypothetical protein
MDMDTLLKAVVPLGFLALWALTHLFNREAKPLPNRVQGPASPYAPKPQAPTRTVTVERSPTLRWSPQGTKNGMRLGNDDDIVILDTPRPGKGAPARGVASARRSRPKPIAPAKPASGGQPKLASANFSQSVSQQISSSITIEPLTAPLESTSVPTVGASAPRGEEGVSFRRSVSVASLINSRDKIRDAILINEILQPPLSLRGRGRRR